MVNSMELHEEEEMMQRANALRFGIGQVPSMPREAFDMYEQLYTSMDASLRNTAAYKLGEMLYHKEVHSSSPAEQLQRSIDLVQESANSGNHEAQHMIGIWLASGVEGHFTRNEGASILHFYFSALSGNVEASRALGYRHMYGYGVPKSCTTAIRYYKYAADKTVSMLPVVHAPVTMNNIRLNSDYDVDRLERLEYSVSSGMFNGINSDHAVFYCAATILNVEVLTTSEQRNRAIEILEQFASEGNSLAQAFVGHLYAHGIHVTADLERAEGMYELSQQSGNAESDYGLGLLYYYGLGRTMDLDLALDHFMKAIEKRGHPDAAYYAAELMDISNPQKAYRYFDAVANAGHVKGLFKIARFTERGRNGVAPSCSAALKHYKSVSDMSIANLFLLNLARKVYQSGDFKTAVNMYTKSAQEGCEVAQHNLAYIYETTNFQTNDDPDMHFINLQRAARQGNVRARLQVGDAHYYGHYGIDVNYFQAAADYSIIRKKSGQASYNLGYMHEHELGVPKSYVQSEIFYGNALRAERHSYYAIMISLYRLQARVSFEEAIRLCVENYWCSNCPGFHYLYNIYIWSSPSSIVPRYIAGTDGIVTTSDNPVTYVRAIHFEKPAYIEITDQVKLEGQTFTLEAWVYIDSPFKSPSHIMGKEMTVGMMICNIDGTIRLLSQYYPLEDELYSNMALTENTWYHFAIVKHESYVALYINGKMDTVRKYRGRVFTTKYLFYIGSRWGDHRFFEGKLALPRVWATDKTPDEIRTLMKVREVPKETPDLLLQLTFTDSNLLPPERSSDPDSVEKIQDHSSYKHNVVLVRRPDLVEVPFPMAEPAQQ